MKTVVSIPDRLLAAAEQDARRHDGEDWWTDLGASSHVLVGTGG